MSYPFLKALSAQPASLSDYKQQLDRTLSIQEQMASELARKNAEILVLKNALENIQRQLEEILEQP